MNCEHAVANRASSSLAAELRTLPHILELPMKSIVVGTAGHIDHGKTALVKALTGIDADRLAEEKRRGITIDLGFAHLELPGPNDEMLRFGFVDVPGHERFVRNMLAGIGGIDLVLFVIAADEGIKPQTREHFDICRLLAVKRGITVLTKADLVDQESLEVVRLEVRDFLRGSFLEKAPIIPVSAVTGTGLVQLKQQLVREATEVKARDSVAIARLPIDRVFTMKGFGTVVTGTLIAGTIRKEDELELFPAGRRVRVRGVQVHGVVAEKAVAGERTALNLTGFEKHELERGMVLATPGLLQASSRIDVKLSLLPSAKTLKHGSRVHLHAFTSETIATVNLCDDKPLKPGAEAFAQLRLSAPLLLLPRDRFIIRQFSPVVTIGGGVVLDAAPMSRGLRPDSEMEILASQDPEAILRLRIWRGFHDGVWLPQLVAETGWTKDMIESQLAQAVESGDVVRIGEMFMHGPAWEVLKAEVVPTLEEFHRKNPLASGIGKKELQVQTDAGDEAFDAIAGTLVREKEIEIAGDLIRLPGRGVVMKDDEAQSREVIEQAFASAGLKVPAMKDVLAGLKIDRARAQKIVTLLLREKVLIKISDDLVFHQRSLAELRQRLAAEKSRSPKLDVGRFKDLARVSRKYAIPLLEYLDRERVTKRVGEGRIIL
jgi:selenocysteine-specific elongation factor